MKFRRTPNVIANRARRELSEIGWVLGTIFEPGMAAGKPLFAGDTVVETLAAVVTRTPDLTAAPAALGLNWNAQ